MKPLYYIIWLCLLYTWQASPYTLAIQSQNTERVQVSEQQEKILNMLLEKQEALEVKYYLLAAFVIFLVLLFGVLCFINKRGDTRLEKIITLLEKSKESATQSEEETTKIDIDEATIATILENLNAFEKERGFLAAKITLYDFAKAMQTNTKYLSKVINTYKLTSVRNYINDLRVQYSIELLKNSDDHKKYTVQAMAKEAGFRTREAFTKAFQKRTGKNVSTFIEQCK